jgi:hypothetical protein
MSRQRPDCLLAWKLLVRIGDFRLRHLVAAVEDIFGRGFSGPDLGLGIRRSKEQPARLSLSIETFFE